MVEDYSGLMSIYSKESPDLLRNAFDRENSIINPNRN